MGILFTEALRFSNTVKHEYEPSIAFCREAVVVNDSAATLAIGTVLGKVTATGKYKVAVETATDGSEVAAAVVIEEKAVPATTDTKVLSIVNGPAILSKAGLVLDASYDDDAKVAAVYAALAAQSIKVNDAV